jgi:hypothetical protein
VAGGQFWALGMLVNAVQEQRVCSTLCQGSTVQPVRRYRECDRVQGWDPSVVLMLVVCVLAMEASGGSLWLLPPQQQCYQASTGRGVASARFGSERWLRKSGCSSGGCCIQDSLVQRIVATLQGAVALSVSVPVTHTTHRCCQGKSCTGRVAGRWGWWQQSWYNRPELST